MNRTHGGWRDKDQGPLDFTSATGDRQGSATIDRGARINQEGLDSNAPVKDDLGSTTLGRRRPVYTTVTMHIRLAANRLMVIGDWAHIRTADCLKTLGAIRISLRGTLHRV